MRAIARRIRQTGMAPGLGPGTDLRRVAISLGLFEGTYGSLLYSLLAFGSFLADLRALNVGLYIGG